MTEAIVTTWVSVGVGAAAFFIRYEWTKPTWERMEFLFVVVMAAAIIVVWPFAAALALIFLPFIIIDECWWKKE